MATQYITPAGSVCDASEATLSNGVLKHGYRLRVACNFMDGRPDPEIRFVDSKTEEKPKTIDEALRIEFKRRGDTQAPTMTTAEFLATMKPNDLEVIAAEVAAKFVSAAASAGAASMFADSLIAMNTAKTEAYRQHNAAVYDLRKAVTSGAYRDPTAPAAPVVTDAKGVRDAIRDARYNGIDPRAAYTAARDAEKQRVTDAWRQPQPVDARTVRDMARDSRYNRG